MEITKELIEKKRAENPGCKLAKVALKAEDEKSVALEVLVKSPDRKIISDQREMPVGADTDFAVTGGADAAPSGNIGRKSSPLEP